LTTCREPTATSRGLVGVYENACHWLYCAAYGSRREQKDPFKKTRKQENSTHVMFHYCSF